MVTRARAVKQNNHGSHDSRSVTSTTAFLTLRDDPIHVRKHKITNEILSNFEHLQLEDDDEIKLELVDELQIAKIS